MTPDELRAHVRAALSLARELLTKLGVEQFAVTIVAGLGDDGYLCDGYSHNICPPDLEAALVEAAGAIKRKAGEG